MRKSLSLLMVLMLLLVGVVSAQDDMADVDPSGQTITYWHQYSDGSSQGDAMAALVQEFNETNEWGITVEAVFQGGYNDIRDQMNATITTGDYPNLVGAYISDAVNFALDDVVVDLWPFYNDATWGYSDEDKADINEGILDQNVADIDPFNGELLGWPNQISANLMVYNQTMLTELGFEGPASTWEEFKAISCAAANSELTGAEGAAGKGDPMKFDASTLESYFASNNAVIFEDGAWNFTSDEAIEVLTVLQDIYNSDCAYIPDSAYGNTNDFALGVNPMALSSSAGVPFIKSGFEASGVVADWSITTTAWGEDAQQTIQLYVPSIIVLDHTAEEELASWLFIKFLAESENQVTWSTATSYFPTRYSTTEGLADYAASDPQFGAVLEIINNPDVAVYTSPKALSYSSVRTDLSELYANITSNGMDVMEAAQLAQDSANQKEADLGE